MGSGLTAIDFILVIRNRKGYRSSSQANERSRIHPHDLFNDATVLALVSLFEVATGVVFVILFDIATVVLPITLL